jgi:hypothetical protein
MPRAASFKPNGQPVLADDQTSLLTLFILSPTAGTVVAAWRGVKLLVLRYRERLLLETRALGLHSRGYAQIHRRCPECGFGALRTLGDHAFRPRIVAPAGFGPHDLRCDRPGCHHLARRVI